MSQEPTVPPKRKPFHKHLAHHAKRYTSHFTKYLYERDTIFATLWVFIFILFVKFAPLPNMHFLDPLEIAMEDFDINDISYSKLGKTNNAPIDNRMVIVNIEESDREVLAYMIEKVATLKPAVIGLDVLFEGPKEESKDSILRNVLLNTKNLVVANRLDAKTAVHKKHHVEDSVVNGYFDDVPSDRGYANFFNEELQTTRLTSPFEKIDDSVYYSFAAMLVKKYDPAAFEKLRKRGDHYEIINYTRAGDRYPTIGPEQLMAGDFDSSLFKGKIVLMAYLNESKENIEDKKFTPLNEKFAGKSIPDMNGIVVHANIISMVLDKNYIKKLPSWVSILIAVLIGWLHMSFFIRYYLENHIWFHLVAKFAQLLSAIFFVYLGIELYNKFSIKINMSLTLVVIVLAVDIIYFYEAFAVWLHKKFNYRTVFHQKHH